MGAVMSHCWVNPATTVRVMLSDGEALEFDHPVIAKQLMKVYPGHLVVHCSQVPRSGVVPRSKISMLRADDKLQLGQTYCLLRVPPQKGKAFIGSAANTSSGDRKNTQHDRNIQHRLPPLAALHQQQYGAPWRPHLDAIVESPMNTPSRHHSICMSPLAIQAGYVPASALNAAQVAPSPRVADLSSARPSTAASQTGPARHRS